VRVPVLDEVKDVQKMSMEQFVAFLNQTVERLKKKEDYEESIHPQVFVKGHTRSLDWVEFDIMCDLICKDPKNNVVITEDGLMLTAGGRGAANSMYTLGAKVGNGWITRLGGREIPQNLEQTVDLCSEVFEDVKTLIQNYVRITVLRDPEGDSAELVEVDLTSNELQQLELAVKRTKNGLPPKPEEAKKNTSGDYLYENEAIGDKKGAVQVTSGGLALISPCMTLGHKLSETLVEDVGPAHIAKIGSTHVKKYNRGAMEQLQEYSQSFNTTKIFLESASDIAVELSRSSVAALPSNTECPGPCFQSFLSGFCCTASGQV
jgi:hypothetical protein